MAFYQLLAMIRLFEFEFDICISDPSGDIGLFYPADCISKLKFGQDLLDAEIIRFTIDFKDKSIFVLIKGDIL